MQIYKIINLVNNKIYIGKDESNRPNYYGSGKLIKRSIAKYGKSNHIKEILEETSDKKVLIQLEKYWIKKFKSYNRDIGYNISLGGDGGDTMTNNPNLEEIKDKISKTLKGRVFTEEHKKNLRKNHNSKNPKVGEKISKALKGRKKSKEWIEKHRQSLIGRKLPKEQIDKLRECIKETIWYYNPATNKRVRLKKGDKIPKGFIKGRGKKFSKLATNMQLGRKYKFYHNPITKEQKRVYNDQEPPKNWVEGMSKRKPYKSRGKIAQYDLNGNLIKIYDGVSVASKELGIGDSCISSVCTGKQKTAGGFFWKKIN
jgi:group I intron endonuclease